MKRTEWFFLVRQAGNTTLSITAFGVMKLSIKGFSVTLSINGTQHNNTVIMLSVTFYFLLCWMSLFLMSLCWVSWRRKPSFKTKSNIICSKKDRSNFSRGAIRFERMLLIVLGFSSRIRRFLNRSNRSFFVTKIGQFRRRVYGVTSANSSTDVAPPSRQ